MTYEPCPAGVGAALFFFLLALSGRAICTVGFIERPLVIGLAWWVCTGEALPALPLAIFFELFWLDLFAIGSFIPPMAAFPYLALLTLSGPFSWVSSSSLAIPLMLSLPLAYVIPRLEDRLRRARSAVSDTLVRQAREQTSTGLQSLAGRLLYREILYSIGLALTLFLVATISLYLLFALLGSNFPHSLLGTQVFPNVEWPILYGIAGIGAFLSLRIKRAYLVFALCMTALLLIALG